MLRINEWQVKREQKLACGHTVERGAISYTIMLAVCADDVTCLPQMILACFESVKSQTQVLWQPSLLYRLWHFLWGKKPEQARSDASQPAVVKAVTNSSNEGEVIPMAQTKRFTANRELKLDCGHTIKTGESFQVTSIYTCNQEGAWPLKILLACFAVLKQQQSVKPAAQAEKPQTTAK